ncbi:hypothetical protein NIES4075_08680 [Tolypothrix sp. NIES-4075]|nr:hypothetical protein NIES4075_08680 [Tolypothrix sp. NIES-4075]
MIETVNDTISDTRKTMNLQDFESQYRNSMDETLNELQTAMLLLAQAQRKISEIGNNVQNFSQIVEEFIASQKSE